MRTIPMNPINLFLNSLFSPKLALGFVVKIKLKWSTVIEGAIFVSIVNTILTHLLNSITYSTTQVQNQLLKFYLDLVFNKPILLSLIELFQIFFFAALLTFGGRLFNGKGEFLNNLKGVVWIHFIIIFINVILFILTHLSFALASFLILLRQFWFMWALSECAVKVHGFKSTILVFILGVLLFIMLFAFFIQFIDSIGINFLERAGLNV